MSKNKSPKMDVDEAITPALSTLVVVPRDRFTLAIRSLNSIIEHRSCRERLVYVDAGSPTHIASELKSICEENGFLYIREPRFLSPTQARNLGARHAETKYVVFIDNDVVVSPNWLEALENCAEQTVAEVVAPLTCQKEPVHSEVHQAGGQVFESFDLFLEGKASQTRMVDMHVQQGQSVGEVGHARRSIECCEFHCVLVRRDILEKLGGLDEKLLATKEHVDFSLSIWKSGGTILLEPKSVVTFLFPDSSNPLQRHDYKYFLLRWSPEWQLQSLNHFKTKWGLEDDPYFSQREGVLDWRYRDGIAKPLIRKVPIIGRRHRVLEYGQDLLMPILRSIGRRSVRRHHQEFSKVV
jgi:glycosyltransferase involved in cell wall biosynthesis